LKTYLIRDGLKNPLQFIIGHKRKSPKRHLRALKKSHCDQPEELLPYIFYFIFRLFARPEACPSYY